MGISKHLGLRLWVTAGLALGVCLSGAAMAADLTPMPKKGGCSTGSNSQSVDIFSHALRLAHWAQWPDDGQRPDG